MITVTEVDTLQTYLEGVISRADHHAQNVNRVALVLIGAVIWVKDERPIRVHSRKTQMKNQLWFWVQGRKYCLAYNHGKEAIEVRRGSREGGVTHEFTNSSTAVEVFEAFSAMKTGENAVRTAAVVMVR